MLLRLESVHVHGKLSGSHNIGQKNKFPALELSPIAKIEIFSEGIVLPASAFFDTCAPPEAGGSIEIEKGATPAPTGLLQQKKTLHKKFLHRAHPPQHPLQKPPS